LTISAAFTVNGNANPATHTTTYGATVTLALTSIVGASSIQWSVVGTSDSSVSSPTITPAGSPSGATATFVFPSDPSDGRGRTVLVKCLVSDGTVNTGALRDEDQGTHWAVQYAVISVPGTGGFAPIAAGEGLDRSLTHGWITALNQALAGTSLARCVLTKSASQSLTNAAGDEAITWNTRLVNRPGTMHSGSSADVTVPFTGAYRYRYSFMVTQAGTARVRKNAAGSPTTLTSFSYSANVPVSIDLPVSLVAGDTLRLEINVGADGSMAGGTEAGAVIELVG
jgi:hypothetical protein